MHIVIIGLGTAGFAAALAIKKTNREAEVTIIDKKTYHLLHPCGLPFALEGKVKLNDLKHEVKLPDTKIISNAEVIKIDPKYNELEYKKDNKEIKLRYNKLIIATGSKPFIPDIKGKELAHTMHSIEDIETLKKQLKKIKNIVIIGASAIGLETAIALRKLNVSVIDILPNVFPKLLDKDMSNVIEEYLTKQGVKLLLNKKIKNIEKDKVILEDEEIKTDTVIMATGVRASTSLAEKIDITTGNFGILINKEMKTNIEDIYAAGDCVQPLSLVTKKPTIAQIATVAYRQGTIAGSNAAGKHLTYEGTAGTFVSILDDLEIAATGINSYLAEQLNYKIVTAKAKQSSKPEWFPGGKPLTLKLIVNKDNKKLLGAQAIGYNAASKINVLSAAIQAGFTVNDLANIELAYCPAVSQTYDIIHLAADLIIKKI